MKSLFLCGLGLVSFIFSMGCATTPPSKTGYYPHPVYSPSKTVKPVTASSVATTSTNRSAALPGTATLVSSAAGTNKIVALAPVSATNAVVSPDEKPTVKLVTLTNAPAPAMTNVMQLPATPAPVVITNLVSVTNRVEVAVPAPRSDVEVVNGVQRRAHFRFKDATAEAAFLKIVAKKQEAVEDMRVLSKLYQEKAAQQQQFSASLLEQFAIKPDKSYQFDMDSATISEVVKPATDSEKAKTQLHMKLKDASAVQAFTRLSAARRISMDEMASLQLIYREKQMEISEYDRQLAESYAVVKDRSYQYDQANRTLFELIKLPDGVEAPGAGVTSPGK